MGKDNLIVTEEVSMLKKPDDNILPSVIRSEVNFLQFPFFALSWRGLKQKTKIEYRLIEEREGQKVELLWKVSANAEYGYPTPFDRKVARAVDAIIAEVIAGDGYPLENPIPFSIYHLAELMGLKHRSGKVYEGVKQSLTRITVTAVESKGSFYLKDEQAWIEDVFHLYERVLFKGKKMRDGIIADTNYVWLGHEYLRNINARYVKPLDYQYLVSLDSDLASRLYEILSRKFYGLPAKKDHLRISYLNLCQVLPIKAQRYLSKAKESLDPAHQELIDTDFLAKVKYEYSKGKSDFNITYYLGRRAKKERQGDFAQNAKRLMDDEQLQFPVTGFDTEPSALAQGLEQRGVSRAVARQLSQDFPEDYLRDKIAMFDFLKSTQSHTVSKNPGGWLRLAIQEDWEATKEQLDAKENQESKHAEGDRQARWVKHRTELIERDLRDWEKVPAEERIKGLLEFSLTRIRMSGGEPSESEVESKKRELIAGLPQTEEERRMYLERNCPLEAPKDFK